MLNDILQERGDAYGSFHTHANLTQTLTKIINQHYANMHTQEGGTVAQLPYFMEEAIHMICHKIGRIANGNPLYVDSWQDIAGYAQLVVSILEQAEQQQPEEPPVDVSHEPEQAEE